MTTQSSSVSTLRPSLFLYQSPPPGDHCNRKTALLLLWTDALHPLRMLPGKDCCSKNQTGKKTEMNFEFVLIFYPLLIRILNIILTIRKPVSIRLLIYSPATSSYPHAFRFGVRRTARLANRRERIQPVSASYKVPLRTIIRIAGAAHLIQKK